ncbi:hypothetical protein C2E23DRAFT_207727 [Lenzites betulinus]|nr:hypothetical protein C2E23DRAFT_207727 [Lenzites betulinus]
MSSARWWALVIIVSAIGVGAIPLGWDLDTLHTLLESLRKTLAATFDPDKLCESKPTLCELAAELKHLAGIAVYVVIPIVALALLLFLIGFTPAGIALGSLAALIQSVFYGAATGGLFATLQSVGVLLYTPWGLVQ